MASISAATRIANPSFSATRRTRRRARLRSDGAGMRIRVLAGEDRFAMAARRLAARLREHGVETGDDAMAMIVDASGISLDIGGGAPIRADFVAGRIGYRLAHGLGRRQPLPRAVGLGRGIVEIIDATAGLGRDAFVLAALGARVRMIERNIAISVLLEDGLRRALDHPATRDIARRMQLLTADSQPYLEGLSAVECPDAVYLDPMYPHSGKSAMVKKEMQALRLLLGSEPQDPRLLAVSRAVARRRVIVKRPRRAPPLAATTPDFEISAPNTRFDVYLSSD